MLKIDDVHFSYDGLYTALRGVSLQIDQGERIAVVGTNGAGKTTLVKHMNGLIRPNSGHVFLNDRDTKKMSVAEMAKTVGLVFQSPDHQLFLETVEKEVVFGLRNLGYSEEEAKRRCDDTLARLGLEGFADRSPFTLSGGERKRVALASVLATEPKILALDEPTIGQDAYQKKMLADLLTEMNSEGCTVIVVTHDIEFVVEYFPRTVAMSGGLIVGDGPTNALLSNSMIIERCSLSAPQTTIAAIALKKNFPQVSDRITSVQELEDTILNLVGGF
ncbi:MAG: ATP-binding cassette domain-containing protein [Candidatus Lokiarchaeota archaeon]|nr:ATP-binding cassette domain-containing protein [Candidatus Lokiarchaeota archaeon]